MSRAASPPPACNSPFSILFLDQSGQLGGAELFLLDIAQQYRDRCQVALFTDGEFRKRLQQDQIPVQVLLNRPITVRKHSGWLSGVTGLAQLLPLIVRVARLSTQFDLIYANTQKALVVGAIASRLSARPLVYHLHDILSPDHFSASNLRLAVALANRCAARVIATSQAARQAFIQSGGRAELATVVYNGFLPQKYQIEALLNPDMKGDVRASRSAALTSPFIFQISNAKIDSAADTLRCSLPLQKPLENQFVVGQFSRLSPWKGQHILIKSLAHCPEDVIAVLVGDALYGETAYIKILQALVQELQLQHRVHFLGFQSDVVPLMHCCDVIAHTSTAPEPFGRVIVEAMLCDRPVIATAAGGATEIVENGATGWLVPPDNVQALTAAILQARAQPEQRQAIAHRAKIQAAERFHLDTIHQQLDAILRDTLTQVTAGRSPTGLAESGAEL